MNKENMIKVNNHSYKRLETCSFMKTNEPFGDFSNMSAGYRFRINTRRVLTSEACYQMCRFPGYSEIQNIILHQKNTVAAKIISNSFKEYTKDDWDEVKVDIMRWCLAVKLASHYRRFGQLLDSTSGREIVQVTYNDRFWGAMADKENYELLEGKNLLGQLLMELRDKYRSAVNF
jgi:ribA/ribD-fused uncharacterized protein